jgi:hypothetical protein
LNRSPATCPAIAVSDPDDRPMAEQDGQRFALVRLSISTAPSSVST